MIKLIAAIDINNGLANDNGIPWNLPEDVKYFREKTAGSTVLMGRKTYEEFKQPLENRENLVLSSSEGLLRPGFKKVYNLKDFIKLNSDKNIWIIGGSGLFSESIEYADQLFLTRVGGDFECTKFFPEFEDKFHLIHSSEEKKEGELGFRFEIWAKNK